MCLNTVIRRRFQVKPATLLILIDPFSFISVEELYGTRYQSGSFSLINVGSGISLPAQFFLVFWPFSSHNITTVAAPSDTSRITAPLDGTNLKALQRKIFKIYTHIFKEPFHIFLLDVGGTFCSFHTLHFNDSPRKPFLGQAAKQPGASLLFLYSLLSRQFEYHSGKGASTPKKDELTY